MRAALEACMGRMLEVKHWLVSVNLFAKHCYISCHIRDNMLDVFAFKNQQGVDITAS